MSNRLYRTIARMARKDKDLTPDRVADILSELADNARTYADDDDRLAGVSYRDVEDACDWVVGLLSEYLEGGSDA